MNPDLTNPDRRFTTKEFDLFNFKSKSKDCTWLSGLSPDTN